MKPAMIDTTMTDPEGGAKALKAFLYSNRRRANAVRLMDTDWPQAALLRELLVDYVSLAAPLGRGCMVLNAIDRGALAYEKALGCKPDPLRLGEFINAVIASLSQDMAGLRVTGERNNTWLPYSGQPLSVWMAREKNGRMCRCAPVADESRLIRAALISYLDKYLPDAVKEYQDGG